MHRSDQVLAAVISGRSPSPRPWRPGRLPLPAEAARRAARACCRTGPPTASAWRSRIPARAWRRFAAASSSNGAPPATAGSASSGSASSRTPTTARASPTMCGSRAGNSPTAPSCASTCAHSTGRRCRRSSAARPSCAARARRARCSYSLPKAEEKPLPAGTIFPTEHVTDLIAAARAGEQILSRQVFDGSGEDALTKATAVIGAAKTGDRDRRQRGAALAGEHRLFPHRRRRRAAAVRDRRSICREAAC